MLVICGGECTGCRHPGSGNGGMPDGLWSKPGLRWRWPRRWDGMPIPLAGGLPSSARAVRGRWPSSSRVVPPAIDGVRQTELKAVVQEFPAKVGLDLANWTLRQAQEEGGAQICAGTFRGLPEPQQLPELPAPLGICAETVSRVNYICRFTFSAWPRCLAVRGHQPWWTPPAPPWEG